LFIDRESELHFLEEKWRSGDAQLVVLWGRRRVGKTELIKRFFQGKRGIYFLADLAGGREQLARLSRVVGEFFDDPLLRSRAFGEWEDFFRYLRDRRERIVVVIDEFPYLIQADKSVPSLFQKGWDEFWAGSKLFVVLLGSSVGLMETEVLDYKAPLYGRRTGQWRVRPLPFAKAREFRPGGAFGFDDAVRHYAVAGGIPAYWLWFDAELDFFANLAAKVLRKGEPAFDEVEFLLREELREPRYYFTLLQAIAHGKRKLGEIVNSAGMTVGAANKYLGVLADLEIVEREVPITEAKPLKSKKGLYRIVDEFVRFWFRFVFPRRGELEMGRTERVVEDIRREMPSYLGQVYERIAAETMLAERDVFGEVERVGRWWDRTDEIDLVAPDPRGNRIWFGEVKWSEKPKKAGGVDGPGKAEKPVGTEVWKSLRAKAARVGWGDGKETRRFVIFSGGGFTSEMRRVAAENSVVLYHGTRRVE